MLQRIQNLLKASSLYIAVLVTLVIAYLSLKETGPAFINATGIDKVEHALAYFTLSICWLAVISKSSYTKKMMLYVVLGCISYGILLEVLQATLTLHRTLELLDMVANSTGVLLGLLMFLQISKKNQVN